MSLLAGATALANDFMVGVGQGLVQVYSAVPAVSLTSYRGLSLPVKTTLVALPVYRKQDLCIILRSYSFFLLAGTLCCLW